MQHISYQWITKQRLRKAGRIRPLVGLEEAKEYNYSVDRPNLCGVTRILNWSILSFWGVKIKAKGRRYHNVCPSYVLKMKQ